MNIYQKCGFMPADVLIPKNADLTKWTVVACDQYTSEPDYWNEVEKLTENTPSALHITLPEIYLSDDNSSRINNINSNMAEYIAKDIFNEYKTSFILSERKISNGDIRTGIIGAVDLECYDFQKGSENYIRATEGTIIERIPPRVKIRENAPLELPHIMLLADDKNNVLFKAFKQSATKKIYDFELMQNSGHLTGYIVPPCLAVEEALDKYFNDCGEKPLLFAVGDGNHSLATAKTCWENIKATLSDEEITDHPARYALVEIVDINEASLKFEPIHRVLFNCDGDDFICKLNEKIGLSSEGEGQYFTYYTKTKSEKLYIKNPTNYLTVGTLQTFIDDYIESNNIKIDYVHGDDVVENLGKADGNLGIKLPPVEKGDFFNTIKTDGSFPRKTFSMGHAADKRFYLEARKITK